MTRHKKGRYKYSVCYTSAYENSLCQATCWQNGVMSEMPDYLQYKWIQNFFG